jgi:hypothetical protein
VSPVGLERNYTLHPSAVLVVVGVSELKQCVVCGLDFDPSEPDQWACMIAHMGRHIPTDRPGTVYILHFDAPTMVADADNGHVRPTTGLAERWPRGCDSMTCQSPASRTLGPAPPRMKG